MQLQNENKLDERSIILQNIMTLVPSLPSESEVELPDGGKVKYDSTKFFKILLGGDQLTIARVHGTQCLFHGSDKAMKCLQGIIPVQEDWHARMNFMKVRILFSSITILCKAIWKQLYSRKSANEKGTLYQVSATDVLCMNMVKKYCLFP